MAAPGGDDTPQQTAGLEAHSPPTRPLSPRRFFLVWLTLGAQSFGGGATTMVLIHRAAVEQYGWATEAEFVRDWALVQMAPGINLLGLTTLLGRRALGAPGIALALTGLLLPSGLLTIVLSALYAHIAGLQAVQAALRGIVPATVGLSLITAWQMARPLLKDSRREGAASLLLAVAILAGSGAAYALWAGIPIVAVFCTGGGAFALYRWASHTRTAPLAEAAKNEAEAEAEGRDS